MKKGIKTLVTCGFLCLITALSSAADLTISGKAAIPYQPKVKNSRQTAADEAQQEAIRNGLDAMMSTQAGSIRQLYEERKPDIYKQLFDQARDVENTTRDNKATSCMEVKVTAVIDEDVVKDTLMSKQAVKKMVTLDDTLVAVFFTAREVASVERHEARVNTESSTSASAEASIVESSTGTNLATSESRIENKKSSAGVSRTHKADTLKYELDGPSREEFGAALSARMLDKGFENIIDGAMLDVSAVLDEAYSKGNVVSPSVWRQVSQSLKEEDAGIRYLIVGTIDFGYARMDNMTGMWVVEATMTGKVYELGKRLPRMVAALQPKTHKGRAEDQLQAKKRALAGITPIAVDEMLAKLKAKNIIKP